METLLQVLRTIGPARAGAIGAAVVAIVGLFVWFFMQIAEPNQKLLYSDLDPQDSERIVAELESQGITHELRNGGTAIYVPETEVDRVRVKLAAQGLPSGGSIGYELFDQTDTLGSTDFQQNINLVRALEGELSRTIRAIDNVKNARVHLVLPRRELFSRDRQPPSASVLLRMHGMSRLNSNQVLAVQHLIASAVPALEPQNISIVDGQGKLLSDRFDGADGAASISAKAEERRREFQARLARTVETLLEKTVGIGKVRTEVFADMDFDRINTSEEIYDPDGQVVRSTQAIEETASNKEGAGDLPVSVATNLPDADLGLGDGSASSANESRTEETVNYEISKRVINHVRESGSVNRLSVAVLVDGLYVPQEDGTTSYQPRPQEELDLLATLVRSAIGFDEERGDTVEVINMQFAQTDLADDPQYDLIFGLEKGDLFQMAQYLILVVFAILVLLLVIRPLVGRALEAIPVPAAAGAGGDLLTSSAGHRPALAPPGGVKNASTSAGAVAVAGEGLGEDYEHGEEMIDLKQVEGRVKASTMKKVNVFVDRHPDETVGILRQWLHGAD